MWTYECETLDFLVGEKRLNTGSALHTSDRLPGLRHIADHIQRLVIPLAQQLSTITGP